MKQLLIIFLLSTTFGLAGDGDKPAPKETETKKSCCATTCATTQAAQAKTQQKKDVTSLAEKAKKIKEAKKAKKAKDAKATKQTSTQSPGAAGMVAVVGNRGVEEGAELPPELQAELATMVNTSSEGLREVVKEDGTVIVDLQGRFQSATVAVIGKDGKLKTTCVSSAPGHTCKDHPAKEKKQQ